MARLSSHTLNIHHGPESRTISLLFDADKTSQIEPVSKVKKTKLCIKETLKEKVPRKWFCAGCSPVDHTAAGKTRACRHPAFRRNNILKASSVKSVYVITCDLKICRTTYTGSLGLYHYCAIIVPLLYHCWDFYPVTPTCSKKSKRAEQNFGNHGWPCFTSVRFGAGATRQKHPIKSQMPTFDWSVLLPHGNSTSAEC